MTHHYAGHYGDKHGQGSPPESRVAEAIGEKAAQGELSCQSAFEVVEQLGITPSDVGSAVDLLEIKLARCQLGLFGHTPGKRLVVKPAESVSPELEQAIRKGLVNGKLPCATAWDLARQFGMPKMSITAACEKLSLRIKPCQLGAF